MKIVINVCYGGFGLSDRALKLYGRLKGHKFNNEGPYPHVMSLEGIKIYDTDISRDDEVLVKVVEKLQEEANGRYSELKAIEIPDGTYWVISDYDGIETVEEEHQSWS